VVLAHRNKSPVLGEGAVGVIVHVHLKTTTMKTLLTPNKSPLKRKYRIWNKANSSKEKVKMSLFGYNSVPERTTKNMGNSLSFLSVTHTTLSAKRFRRYGVLKIDFAAEFCFWTEQ
jgi:hypothetical protein